MQDIKTIYTITLPGDDNITQLMGESDIHDCSALVNKYDDIISNPYSVKRLKYKECDGFINDTRLWGIFDKVLESYPSAPMNGYIIEAKVVDIDRGIVNMIRAPDCQRVVHEWRIPFDNYTEARVYLKHEIDHNNNDLELKIYSTNRHLYNQSTLKAADTMVKLLDTRDNVSGTSACTIS